MINLTASRDQTFYLLIIGNVLVLGLIGYFVLRPIFANMAERTAQITQTKAETAALERKATDLRKLKETYPQYELRYGPLIANLPKTKDTAGYQTELEDLAKLTSVTLSRVDTSQSAQGQTQPGQQTAGGFPVIPVKAELIGSYAGVSDFISRVETMDRYTRVTGLEISTVSDAGVVKATLELQTLYFPSAT